jgi:hypothetical protein
MEAAPGGLPDERNRRAAWMRSGHLFTNHTEFQHMAYQHTVQLKALLRDLEAAKTAAKEAARNVARERSPLAKAVRDIQYNLERAQASRHKMVYGNGVCIDQDERTAAYIHGQRWRDTLARITSLNSQLLDAELRLAFFDKDNSAWHPRNAPPRSRTSRTRRQLPQNFTPSWPV